MVLLVTLRQLRHELAISLEAAFRVVLFLLFLATSCSRSGSKCTLSHNFFLLLGLCSCWL